MKFVRIFDGENPSDLIWSCCTEDGGCLFWELMDSWRDVPYLVSLLRDRASVLTSGFFGLTFDEALDKISLELDDFEDELGEVVDMESPVNAIKSIFVSLHEYNASLNTRQDSFRKASPNVHKPIVRFYGIELSGGIIIITGGGLKITRTMQEDPLLEEEKRVMIKVSRYLDSVGIVDLESLKDYLGLD